MKVTKQNLSAAISRVLPVVGRRQTIPILGTVHLSASEGRLHLRATDLDQEIKEEVECEGDLPPCCVPASRIGKLIDGATEQIEMKLTARKLKMQSGFSAEIATIDHAEFPPATTPGIPIGINCNDLADGIEAVAFCACTDGIRQNLCSVHIRAGERELVCEAFNGSSGFARYEMAAIAAKIDVLLPAIMAPRFAAALKRDGAQLMASDSRITATHAAGFYSAVLVNEKFFDTGAIIKAPMKALGTVNRQELLAHLRACGNICNSDRIPAVQVDFGDGLAVSFSSSESSYSASMEGKFAAHTALVHARTFCEYLEAFSGNDLLMKLSELNTALVMQDGNLMVATAPLNPKAFTPS